MRNELLPCPFCGAGPFIQPWHGGPKTKRRVGCENDQCPVMPGTTGDTRKVAVERWNTRSVNAALDCIAARRAELGEGMG